MKFYHSFYIFFCFPMLMGIPSGIFAQETRIVYLPSTHEFILSNRLFERKLRIDINESKIESTSFRHAISGHEYILPDSREFSFSVNGRGVTGIDGYFTYQHHNINENAGRSILDISFTGREDTPAADLEVIVFYEIYDDLPMTRKWIRIINTGNTEIRVENLFIEDLFIDPSNSAGVDIFKSFGREWTKPPYEGGTYDPAIFIRGNKGSFILGNEAPGMMKFTSVYKGFNEIKLGLNPADHAYPFRRYLDPNEVFVSPEVFIILTPEASPEIAFENELGKFIREHMGVKLFKREHPPLFLYNTWNPFRINIDESLIRELTDALEETGVEYLIIDDGWQDHNGDWNVNKDKFPKGLKPVTDYIRKKGMKPGLWISLTIAEKESRAFQKYREYAVTDASGTPANLHGWSNNLEILTMKIASPWYDHIKNKMRNLVMDYGIRYFKIDLGMVKSAYIMEKERSGSYDENEFFKGREEYLYMAFEKTNQLFDELAAEFPDLIIDCTFELWGDWHIIDYSLVKHADVDWISNFEAPPPEGSRTVRQLAYHHGMVVPTSCMVIGNQKMEVENHELSVFSNMASTPIMLGDPRQLSSGEKKWFKNIIAWLSEMNRKYEIFKYYQTSEIFNAPLPHNWDGFARFNPEADGGIICVFRNEQMDASRTFTLPWCREENSYLIIDAESGVEVGEFSGKLLRNNGLTVRIEEINQAKAFEIRPLGKK
ncbi:MAG: alpha-galactosidase [Cyclobacteriaceae bacterium]|nr:alpha-galactosidase [Cyclobacteriaceae bacterium]